LEDSPVESHIEEIPSCNSPPEQETVVCCDKSISIKSDEKKTKNARRAAHVNYTWRSLADITNPTLGPGKTINVHHPDGSDAIQVLQSETLLCTRGAEAALADGNVQPAKLCVHFVYNRICQRGARCSFIHVVRVDPSISQPRVQARKEVNSNKTPIVARPVPQHVPQQQFYMCDDSSMHMHNFAAPYVNPNQNICGAHAISFLPSPIIQLGAAPPMGYPFAAPQQMPMMFVAYPQQQQRPPVSFAPTYVTLQPFVGVH